MGSLSSWMKKADVGDGNRPGLAEADRRELRETNNRIRLLDRHLSAPAFRNRATIARSGIAVLIPINFLSCRQRGSAAEEPLR